jgi:16S rRNA (uracil1498-N3)-methyltransferase
VATRKARSRFFIDPSCIDLGSGTARCDEARLAHQVRNVLRLKVGDQVQLLDGLGQIWEAKLVSAGRTFIEFSLENAAAEGAIPGATQVARPFRLLSCLPLIKAQRFEWALEKLCELGVSQILPFHSERCAVKLKADEASRGKRWLTICKEASEQCERLLLPELLEPLSLEDLLAAHAKGSIGSPDCGGTNGGGTDGGGTNGGGTNGGGTDGGTSKRLKLILSERNEKAPDMVSALYNHLAGANPATGPLDLLILSGPEGGFSDNEQKLIAASGFMPVSLGALILRSETACILAAGVVSAINFYKDSGKD